ncbi:efflux transporter outer membrane subunit [Luteolibacter luteus]|uniref:Efflux transporter outer membrane subunit n=1 Tax=Luteolibacter luteus TaxID=2728835 RepID=A0A858RHE9_9BACT|nr:efflux transporter outer membrane subunit [Luteolibacter luteus]QJE95690.1 efflux transporter outer membrane subunit [Luteolibacter luteus]
MLELRSLGLLSAVLLAGCNVGPNFEDPLTSVPMSFRFDANASSSSIADLPWWKVYHDPKLQSLINEALSNNHDLRIAITRVEQARQVALQTRSLGLPSVDYGGGISRGRNQAGGTGSFTGGRTADDATALLSVVWEVDLWGRIRRLSEADLARYLATDEARCGVIVSLIGDVAQTYFELLELDLEKEIAIRSRDSFQESFNLFDSRLQGGVASTIETSRAKAATAQAAATIPDIERLIAQKENQLSILTGRAPGPIHPRGKLDDNVVSRAVPAGLPSSMIRRRPDIRQSEQLLRAANAEVGAAIAEYYPKIGLTAFAGRISPDLSDLSDGVGNAWSVASSISGPIFNGGRLKAQEAQARAAFDEAKLRHEKTVLVALGEVSNALVSRQKFAAARADQEQAVHSLTDSVGVSTERYSAGRANYFEILDAQLELFPTELQLARIRLNEYLAVVGLYRALGGGCSSEAVSSSKQGL